MLDRNCPVCEHTEVSKLFHPKHSPGEVVRCLKCGFIFIANFDNPTSLIMEGALSRGLDPKVLTSSDLNDLPKGYWEFNLLPRKLIEAPALQKNSLYALEKIQSQTQIGKILDFGCGWGFFLITAKELGWECFGIEPLPGHSLFARAKFSLNVITDTIHDGTYPESFFDAITAFEVFEHLSEPLIVLRRLAKFQKTGGVLVIEVPNIDTWGVRLLGKHHRHFTPDHINFFSAKTLRLFLERNGYRVLETYYPTRYMTLNNLVNYWFRRILPGKVVDWILKQLNHRDGIQRIIPINLGDILTAVAIRE